MAISVLMRSLYLTSLFACVLFTRSVHTSRLVNNVTNTEIDYERFERLAKSVNDANSTWTADVDSLKNVFKMFASIKLGLSLSPRLKNLGPSFTVGAKPDEDLEFDPTELPEEFDLRKQYPQCTNIGHLSIQSDCGSCWAVATANALSDRMCVATHGKLNHLLSADHLLSCCPYCRSSGDVCEGGDPLRAWLYIKKQGLPTGGDYATHQGCKPYRISPCNLPGYPRCKKKPVSHLQCSGTHCSNPYFRTSYWDNLFFVRSAYLIEATPINKGNYSLQEAVMKYEILKYGSIVAAMTIYEDFLLYRKGVYQHITGKETGGHGIKVIGWGLEEGVAYWLCVNSWSRYWGEAGTVKIRRGVDESSIETMQVTAGVFDTERSSDLVDFVYDTHGHSDSSTLGQKQMPMLMLLWSLLTFLRYIL